MTEPSVDEIRVHEDDRGGVYCVLDDIGVLYPFSLKDTERRKIKRTYVVKNWSKNFIRAWHGHKKAWTGIHVIKGAAKLVAMKMDDHSRIITRTFSDKNLGILWIPPGWYNGTMSLEDDTRMLVYSTLTFADVKNDDYRLELSENDKKLFKAAYR